MRAYYFGNMYLSSIQQGIQAAHVTHEMFNKYLTGGTSFNNTLYEWSLDHKTMILLNAGYGEQIHALVERFTDNENPYPWADFHEAEESLDGAITCVGIVLPEKIYESSAFIRRLPYRKRDEVLELIQERGEIRIPNNDEPDTVYQLSKWEFDFIQDLGNYGMAR